MTVYWITEIIRHITNILLSHRRGYPITNGCLLDNQDYSADINRGYRITTIWLSHRRGYPITNGCLSDNQDYSAAIHRGGLY